MRADRQLARLLYILPVCAREGGARIDDLARALDVTPQQVLRDLEAAMTRAYYHPAGSVDPFTILIEGDVVRVHAPREFQRPVRLTHQEALALGIGLRMLAAEAEQPRRAELLALANRLEADLVASVSLAAHGHLSLDADLERPLAEPLQADAGEPPPPHEVEFEPDFALALGDDAFRGIVTDAIDQHRMLRITYLKPGDAMPLERLVAPYRLVFAEGSWYIAGHDTDREDFSFFRLDRVLDAQLDEPAADSLPDVDVESLLEGGIAYHARDDMQATVRYSGAVARWIVEQHEVAAQEDGSVVVTHSVADPGWFVRHVLQYGGAATVQEPVEARRWVRAAARRVAEQGSAGS
ncbi:MAG: helix-turn-helix transcriptional regulator [Longimicrobiales bacterium]